MNNYIRKEKSKETIKSGTSFLSLLTVAFIVLKLCGVIAWSWWWVLAPVWVSIVLLVIIIVICSVIIGLINLFSGR